MGRIFTKIAFAMFTINKLLFSIVAAVDLYG